MAAYPAVTISEVAPEAWDAILKPFPDATVFHSLPWLRTVCENHRLAMVLAQAQTADGRSVAVWPALIMRKGPLKIIGSPLPGWSTAYLGPIFQAEADVQAIVHAFLQHTMFRRSAYFAIKCVLGVGQPDFAPFGFTRTMNFDTFRIDLTQPEDALWNNLKSENRTRIRKAQKLGIELKSETTPEFINDYWAMSLETYAKSSIMPTHDRDFVERLWKHLQPIGRLYVLSAWKDGKRLATLVLPTDDRGMYYWGGASYQEHRDIPSHNLLHWEAIQEAKRRGLQFYDFISTFGGPGRFKKTFGPQTIDIASHWERSASPLLGMVKRQYEKFLRRRRKVTVS